MRNTRRRSGETGSLENGHATPEPNGLPSDSAATTPSDSKKKSKKRKFEESPPWKSATTQTPTSFVTEDGRRRSGRTNIHLLELMPPPSRQKKPQPKTEVHSVTPVSRPRAQSSSSKKSKTKASLQSPPTRASSRLASTTAPNSSTKVSSTSKTPPKKSTSRPRAASKSTPTKPVVSSKSQRSPAIGTRKSARALQKALAVATEELERGRALQKLYANDDNDDSSLDSYDEIESIEGDIPVDLKLPTIKLKFNLPKAVITHPSQVVPPPKFASFEEFLQQDDVEHNEELRLAAEQEAREEAKTRNRLEYEARHGLLTKENCSLFLPEKQPEPERQYGHWDHLIAHALNFQKLMMKERREHQELMRKRNIALMAEITRRRPRTKEEIEQEQYLENRRFFKEQISQLRRKWEEVTKEVERRRIQRAEEERRQAGKEQLNQMLKHSTQLLDARRGDRQGSLVSVSEADADNDIDSDEDDSDVDDADEADQGDIDEANMSTSESEIEIDDDNEDDDTNLTVEQLRAKYSGIAAPVHTNSDDMDIDQLPFSDDDEPVSDVDMADERLMVDDQSERNSATAVPLDEVDETLMDDSDESTDMNSDEDSDLEDNEDEDGDDDDEDEEEDTGLLGFYGGINGFSANITDEPVQIQHDSEFGDYEEDEDMDAVDLVGVPKPDPRPIQEVVEYSVPDVEIERDVEPDLEPEVEHTLEFNGIVGSMNEEVVTSNMEPTITPALEETGSIDIVMKNSVEEPRIIELEDDGVTPKTLDEEAMVSGNLGSIDVETATSTSQIDPKDSGPQSSPTTSPDTTPQPISDLKTPIPFLLRGTLREYQHYGLDWLVGLYNNQTNGILADEMGLGKTIQTIALISHLACEKGDWGPHLIVVPTSVMLNWEMEFKKWAPGFKILTYYGNKEQRAEKRKGWYSGSWHVCITSYQLVLQDAITFKRRNWHYLILDEAHNIKNFRSQRWQTLLNFKSEARLLLTGTPLQNNLVELWSLLYFLMPSGSTSLPTGFANLQEFQEWFAHPVDQLIEGGREGMDDEAKRTVTKLHKVLRPYLLRRLKADVEKQMPAKYEHVVYCRLSKRQRYLYDDFMSMAKTRETLSSGNYLSIINCLMQLRKVCNHPDLFETRQIVTSFSMQKSAVSNYEIKELLVRRKLLNTDHFGESFDVDFLEFVGLVPARKNHLSKRHTKEISVLSATEFLQRYYEEKAASIEPCTPDLTSIQGNSRYMKYQTQLTRLDKLKTSVQLNRIRTRYEPLCSTDLVEVCTRDISTGLLKPMPKDRKKITDWFLGYSDIIRSMIPTITERAESMESMVVKFGCVTPAVVATDMPQIALAPQGVELVRACQARYPEDPFHQSRIRQSIAFPDKRLLQYDCGKLQRLDGLLRDLQAGGHRALIFTQMTKVLDILEQFLNIHGHRYLRLDGATKVEQRQALTDRFNNDTRIPVFILSTRSGGLGINLTGADTVIFYDLDWNPAMDKQCQDRCHRIGQTRDVHIYRFVSEFTIESNILRKSEQKRMLDDIIIQEGDFTTDYFNKLSIRDMLGDEIVKELEVQDVPIIAGGNVGEALEQAEDMEDVAAAKVAQKEVVETDVADFAVEAGTPQTPRDITTVVTTAVASKEPTVSRDVSLPPKATPAPEQEVPEEDINKGLGHDIYGTGWGRVDREPDHVDDYMIRHMEWELINVPVVIPDKSKKKSKKGKKF
ncbi:helicase swr1 [Geopyxis carbonaria]|nr:helicase swr1 [Geopyxis carbonaria]